MLTAFELCESHWRQNIQKRWKKQSFESSKIRSSLLYDTRTETVMIEDLVRWINIERDRVLRNRDLYLIYKRLCPLNGKRV